jgi:hypothetical protein
VLWERRQRRHGYLCLPVMELRYDVADKEMHIADGSGFLCDRLRPGYEKRWLKDPKVTRTQQGELGKVECPFCCQQYAKGLRGET